MWSHHHHPNPSLSTVASNTTFIKLHLFPGTNDQYIIPWVVISCLIIYLILIGITLWLDYNRIVKRPKLIVMSDVKYFYEEQFYLISIETGNNFLAATSANICYQLYGEKGRSERYVLQDSTLKSIRRSSDITNILISSHKDLGRLEKLRIWHDNAGHYPGWYCRKIIIKNLRTGEIFYFFVDNWLSVHGSGQNTKPTVIWTCFAASNEEIDAKLKNKFSIRKYWNRLIQHHNWISFFTCTPYTIYPRVERLTCSMVLLCTNMFLLTVYFGLKFKSNRAPYEFREINALEDLLAGLLVGFASTFVGILVDCLFRRVERNRVPALVVRDKSSFTPSISEGGSLSTFIMDPLTSRRVFGMPLPEIETAQEIYNVERQIAANRQKMLQKAKEMPARKVSSNESVFHIPSTDRIQTEQWVSVALTRFAKDGNPRHLVRKYPENGEDSDSSNDSVFELHSLHSKRDVSIYNPIKHMQESDSEKEKFSMIESENTELPSRSSVNEADDEANDDIDRDHAVYKKSIIHLFVSQRQHRSIPQELHLIEIPTSEDSLYYFPRWFIFITWIIAILLIISTSSIVILYGFHYGLIRSIDWCISLLFAIIISILFWEPIVVLMKYFLEIQLIKKGLKMSRKELISKSRFVIIEGQQVAKLKKVWPLNCLVYLNWTMNAFKPLGGPEIFKFKVDARRKLKARKGVLDVVVFLIYLFLLVHFMNIIRSRKSWENTRVHEEIFLTSLEDHVWRNDHAFINIETFQHVYHYLKEVFVPAIHCETDLSGNPIFVDKTKTDVWLANRNSLLIGVPRIRQRRVKKGSSNCDRGPNFRKYSYSCNDEFYSSALYDNEEKSNFAEERPFQANYSQNAKVLAKGNDIWKYHGPETNLGHDIGYIAYLGRTRNQSMSRIDFLRLNEWLDSYTREIYIEFTAYNPNVNLYSLASFHLTVLPTSAVIPTVDFSTTRFIGGSNDANVTLRGTRFYVFTLLYAFCCLYLLHEVISGTFDLYKKSHSGIKAIKAIFTDITKFLDFLLPILGVTILANFLRIYFMAHDKFHELDELKLEGFLNLFPLKDRLELQVMFYCLSMILCLVKLWRLLLVSSRRFFIIGFTLSSTKGFMFGCILMYVILLVAFSSFLTINFGTIDPSAKTIPKSILLAMYQTGLGTAFEYWVWTKAEPFWGRVLYATFNIFVIFLFLNVLISTLTLGLQEAKEVSIQRPFRLSYTGFVWLKIQSFLPNCLKQILVKKEEVLSLSSERELELEKSFIQILENHISSIEVQRIREMKEITEQFINNKAAGRQKLVYKKDKMTAKKNKIQKVGESRLNQMRELSIKFIKKVAKFDFSANEKQKYNEFNKKILELKCRKLKEKIKELDDKYQVNYPNYKKRDSDAINDVILLANIK